MLKGVHEFKVRIIALMTKLVARETKNSQLVAVFVRQGIQLNEVPDGRASHSCDVVDQDDLALQLSEVELGAISGVRASPAAKRLALEVVEGSHRTHRRALKDTRLEEKQETGTSQLFALYFTFFRSCRFRSERKDTKRKEKRDKPVRVPRFMIQQIRF